MKGLYWSWSAIMDESHWPSYLYFSPRIQTFNYSKFNHGTIDMLARKLYWGKGLPCTLLGLLAVSVISILQMPAETPPLCVTVRILVGIIPLGAELSLMENYCLRSPSFLLVRQNANEQMCCLGWSTGVEKLAVSKYANNTAIIVDYLEVLCYMWPMYLIQHLPII